LEIFLSAVSGNRAMRRPAIRQKRTGEPERIIPMTLPAAPASVPKIANYAEAQALDATHDFTLQWNSFSPQGPGAFIRLIITDELGKLIFLAPNPCVP
jgi:hypothetical protein